ncbi:MAG: hypothetical protein AAF830_00965 [Pseudomonadota bacterium]
MRKFLWGVFLPSVGLLSLVIGSLWAFDYVFWTYGWPPNLNQHSYGSDWKVSAERRYPSDNGELEAVVYTINDWTNVSLTVVRTGAPTPTKPNYGVSFDWRHDSGRIDPPVEVTWSSEKSIRIMYCGVSVSGTNALSSPVGHFDLEIVRTQSCELTVGGPAGTLGVLQVR